MVDPERTELIVGLIASYQRRLLAYIRSLVQQRSDAEEVLQEVTLFIWRNANEFQPGTEFGAWAYKIAYYQVLAFRKRKQRQRLQFNDELVEQLSFAAPPVLEQTDRRTAALEKCVKKLPSSERELVKMKYEKEATIEQLAEKLKRSVKTAYRILNKIHMTLLDCVQRQLSVEEGA